FLAVRGDLRQDSGFPGSQTGPRAHGELIVLKGPNSSGGIEPFGTFASAESAIAAPRPPGRMPGSGWAGTPRPSPAPTSRSSRGSSEKEFHQGLRCRRAADHMGDAASSDAINIHDSLPINLS